MDTWRRLTNFHFRLYTLLGKFFISRFLNQKGLRKLIQQAPPLPSEKIHANVAKRKKRSVSKSSVRNCENILNQSRSLVKQNQSLFDTQSRNRSITSTDKMNSCFAKDQIQINHITLYRLTISLKEKQHRNDKHFPLHCSNNSVTWIKSDRHCHCLNFNWVRARC